MPLRARFDRLRATSLLIVQAALAVGIAWLVAIHVVGHTRPFFAPISAIVVLGLTLGQRGRRAFEVAGGVALGVAVGDTLVNLIGSGTVQLVVIVALAMAAAVLLGGSAAVVTQTGTSAVLVVVLEQPEGFVPTRALDAAIGAAAALLVSFVLLPVDPLRLVRSAAEPVLAELAGTLDDIAAALDARDRDRAVAALQRARATDPLAQDFTDALIAGRETAFAALPRRRALAPLELYVATGAQLDLALRNVRVLARGALRAIELDDRVPPDATAALRELAAAVRELDPWLRDHAAVDASRRHAIRAAALATRVLGQTANLSVSVIVGSVRSAAVDLLRGTGLDRDEAVRLVRGASVGEAE